MSGFTEDIGRRAANLAEEIAMGLERGRVIEWVEERIASELLDALRRERERCAAVADRRAEMWLASLRRYSSGTWPVGATTEARERSKEAVSIADAIRFDSPGVADV
jgi:hypothetical protein